MTKGDRQLLLQDLCARLPYGVKIDKVLYGATTLNERDIESFRKGFDDILMPYLRPMSSMTKEQFSKLNEYSGSIYDQLDLASFQDGTYKCLDFYLSEVPAYVVVLVFDWLNAHHFDYRGLIESGLALEALENMYND